MIRCSHVAPSAITEVGGEPLERQIFSVLTMHDGRIVRIDDYRHRTEAPSAAGIPAAAGWR
jgi:ketosteroid isomerase-like protein